MAEISLKEYLEKVDTLLRTGKSDEVILHSRQILKHYPKNAAASRYLGQALIRGSDYQEAEPVFRRVLSVYPDDVVAHTSLGDINDRRGKADEAIWHLERALEGAPNDSALVEKWRSLYQRHRKIEDPRFQLTTGAVAHQYIRNGLYAQAIDTLQTTLEKSPRRADLRLLLAQTLWNAGMQVEAAETALDVLDTLPYCLEANRILTLLWLGEGRPSDAQRYLNQIQEVDPYQALQLAQNSAPDDDAFTVPELDYRRIAETQMAAGQPDWLTEINEDASRQGITTELEAGDQELNFEEELPQAFLTDLEGGGRPAAPRPGSTGITGLLAALDQPQKESEELPGGGELPDWLLESAPPEPVNEALLPSEMDADPLAWLEDGGTELADEEPGPALDLNVVDGGANTLERFQEPTAAEQKLPDFFDDADFSEAVVKADLPVGRDEDPLAWLEGSGVELLDEGEQQPATPLIDEEEMVYQDPASINPLAWLERSGGELVDENEIPSSFFEIPTDQEPAKADPMAWLEADSSEESQTILDFGPTASDQPDSLDWLRAAEPSEAPTSSTFDSMPQAAVEDDSLEWLQDDSFLEEILDIEELSDTGGLPTTGINETQPPADFFADLDHAAVATDLLPGTQNAAAPSDNEFSTTDEQTDMSENEQFESQSDDSDLSSFEWLNDEPEAESSAEASAGDLDWMTEVPEEEANWLSEEAGEIVEMPKAAAGPDWLVEESQEVSAVTNEFGWLNEATAESAVETSSEVPAGPDSFDWLSGSEEEPAAEPAEVPDWLASAQPPASAEEEAKAAAETTSSAFDWLSSEGTEEPAVEMADMPDWLASAQPIGSVEEEAEVAAESAAATVNWLSDEQQPVESATDTPDWLSAVAPVTESSDGDIEAEFGDFEMAEDEQQEVAAEMAGMPDWLAGAQPTVDVEEEAEVSSAQTFDWHSDEEEPAASMTDTPDWLSDIAPVTEGGDGDIEAEFGAFEAEEDELEQPAAELNAMPDWLASAQPTADTEEEVEAVGQVEDESFDWLSSDEEEEPAVESANVPDWLSAVAPVVDGSAEDAEADFGDFEIAEDEQQETAAEMADMPAWLVSAQPTADREQGPEFVSESVPAAFDWSEEEPESELEAKALSDMGLPAEVEEDEEIIGEAGYFSPATAVAQTRILPENDFDWPGDESADEPEPEYGTDYEAEPAHSQFGWLEESESDIETIDEPAASLETSLLIEDDNDFEEKILAAASTPPPADNAPDWLNAMVPGLDLDYQAIEDDRPIESTYIDIPARREQPETASETAQATPSGFNWLVDIVDEETSPMRAVQDVPQAPTSRQRFVFTRQPAWLRALTERRERAEPESAGQDDDFELPDWLR